MQQIKESDCLLMTPIIPALECVEQSVIITLLSASAHISRFLRSSPTVVLQTKNAFGDQQLHQDVYCDEIVQKYLNSNPLVRGFASQERPQFKPLQHTEQNTNQGYIITYDPIDGSSIIDTNFAVGSIFSIWKYNPADEKPLIGTTLDKQVNALLVVYGSRTTAILYNSKGNTVQEYTLIEKYNHNHVKKDEWFQSKSQLKIGPKTKMFSPGNLRAVTEHPAYNEAVKNWTNKGYTLRYTGGLVPDIEQVFLKGNGIFTNIPSPQHKAKLRILYEIAAVAFLVQKAGGKCLACKANKGEKQNGINMLQVEIQGYDDRMGFVAGSSEEVQELLQNKCLQGL